MLRTTLARARQDNRWGDERLRRTEQDIEDLKRGVAAAEARVEQAERSAR